MAGVLGVGTARSSWALKPRKGSLREVVCAVGPPLSL
jgi:hypothetical protein